MHRLRKNKRQINVYYLPGDDKYYEQKGLNCNPNYFSFKPRTDVDVDVAYIKDIYSAGISENFVESQALTERNNKAMKSSAVWTLVDKPLNRKVIGSKWVFTLKSDEKNKF